MKFGAKVPGRFLIVEPFLLWRLTTSAELGREAVGLGESAAEITDTGCRWPLIPGVGEVTTSGGG